MARMYESPEETRLVDRMAPGVLSRTGFLGDDPRPLGEIIEADNSTVEGLETTHEQIAAKLGELLDAAMGTYGAPVEVGDRFRAVYREAKGMIPCPWAGCGRLPKGEAELTDRRTGRVLRFTPLSVHLIAEHGFYEGKGSRYRLEPEELARLLGPA